MKLLRTACVILLDDKHVWLSERSNTRTFHGYWQAPGGEVNKEEPVLAGAVRELFEETGLTIHKSRLIYEGVIENDPSCYHCWVYSLSLKIDERPEIKEADKITKEGWRRFTLTEALDLQLMPGMDKILKDIERRL
jgi:8-oxo-dGTP pyrophosphatase MutT (NUDIX family)